MSFSTSHMNVMTAEDISGDTVSPATPRHMAQFEAAKNVAVTLMESGAVGEGPFNLSIGGHAGTPDGEPIGGDSVYVSIMKAYEAPKPVTEDAPAPVNNDADSDDA